MFHLSLLRRPADLLTATGPAPSREAWLRDLFTSAIEFDHRTETFHFVPEEGAEKNSGGMVIGRIGRQIVREENEPPTRGLQETTRDTWIAALVVIDPRDLVDVGQTLAFEVLGPIGQPQSVINSFLYAVNSRRLREHYILEAAPVSNSESFWTFARENAKDITFLRFELIPPNMFGIDGDIDADMRSAHKEENARKVTLAFESDDYLNTDTPMTKALVGYVAKGGGNILAKTKKKKTYNSKRKTKRVHIPKLEAKGAEESLISRVIKAIFRR